MNVNDFGSLLSWIVNGGGMVMLVAWAASWGLEGWDRWQALQSNVKSAIILALSVVLTLFTVWVQALPAETLAQIEPYMNAVVGVVAVWLSTQVAHRLNPMRQ